MQFIYVCFTFWPYHFHSTQELFSESSHPEPPFQELHSFHLEVGTCCITDPFQSRPPRHLTSALRSWAAYIGCFSRIPGQEDNVMCNIHFGTDLAHYQSLQIPHVRALKFKYQVTGWLAMVVVVKKTFSSAYCYCSPLAKSSISVLL